MQRKSTYISLFFLICFGFSFLAGAAQHLHHVSSKSELSSKSHVSFSENQDMTNSGGCMLLEKNENEAEKSLFVQSFLLPFLHSSFGLSTGTTLTANNQPLQVYQTIPVYLRSCNFRI